MNKCPCEKCKQATRIGIASLEMEGAPEFVIEDYVGEMNTGLWAECENCPERNFENEERKK